MAGYFAHAVIPSISELIIEESKEIRKFQLQRQLGSLQRELRLMLAVLDHIESLERPNKDMNGWAQKARIVVRSVEDMIDSFSFKTAKTSRAKKLKRSALYFNEMFRGYQLSPKVKGLLKKASGNYFWEKIYS